MHYSEPYTTTTDDLQMQHAAVQAAYALADREADRLHRMVAAALTDGHSAIELADTLGVTRARIYQLRNKATP